jgi:hypothetical protein
MRVKIGVIAIALCLAGVAFAFAQSVPPPPALPQTINLRASQDAFKQLLQQGLNFSETVSLEKNAAEVRLVLREAGNGVLGSVIIPLSRFFAPPTVAQSPTKQ